jgi:hypothetical protein
MARGHVDVCETTGGWNRLSTVVKSTVDCGGIDCPDSASNIVLQSRRNLEHVRFNIFVDDVYGILIALK